MRLIDFTLDKYRQLLDVFKQSDYQFHTFQSFRVSKDRKKIILRHDVDLFPDRALRMAEIESSMEIVASYMFRSVGSSYNPEIIREIVSLNHEIGFHYESLNLHRGDTHKAIISFKNDLDSFRKLYPVQIISMHGSPTSRIDNRDLWEQYDYHEFGITCEPYFDIDYSEVLYLTDTGRCWNGDSSNIRDRVRSGFGITSGKLLSKSFSFKKTDQIINAVLTKDLPDRIILNTHPQRWTEKITPWIKELIWQNVKKPSKIIDIKDPIVQSSVNRNVLYFTLGITMYSS